MCGVTARIPNISACFDMGKNDEVQMHKDKGWSIFHKAIPAFNLAI